MHVNCKACKSQITVSHKPKGGTTAKGIQTHGQVQMKDGGIWFGPGGGITFTSGGSVGFSKPPKSSFTCSGCGHTDEYDSEEIVDDKI